jgi:hypothetical protein
MRLITTAKPMDFLHRALEIQPALGTLSWGRSRGTELAKDIIPIIGVKLHVVFIGPSIATLKEVPSGLEEILAVMDGACSGLRDQGAITADFALSQTAGRASGKRPASG